MKSFWKLHVRAHVSVYTCVRTHRHTHTHTLEIWPRIINPIIIWPPNFRGQEPILGATRRSFTSFARPWSSPWQFSEQESKGAIVIKPIRKKCDKIIFFYKAGLFVGQGRRLIVWNTHSLGRHFPKVPPLEEATG